MPTTVIFILCDAPVNGMIDCETIPMSGSESGGDAIWVGAGVSRGEAGLGEVFDLRVQAKRGCNEPAAIASAFAGC